jgi:putative peptide zinc metalloprotease protein
VSRTFSENWHRVSALRVALRPTVRVRLHQGRGSPWYVLHERIKNGFFRVPPAGWAFIARLRPEASVDEVWREAIEAAPTETPGQEEVFQLLVALSAGNMLYVEGAADERKLLERAEARARKPISARISELLFMRIPLLDPEPMLRRLEPLIRVLFSPPAAVLALLFLGWGFAEFLLHSARAVEQTRGILQPQNLPLLFIAVFMAKALHEFGHAAMSRRFGAEVRTTGVMLLMFTPLPYVDVTASWGLRSRWQRAAIGAGGMLMDLLVAAAATLVWVRSPAGELSALCHNLMFTTAAYTLLFNLNPLMRFDGYYILSDLVGVPNLYEQARGAAGRRFRALVLRQARDEKDAEHAPGTEWALAAFFIASNGYRLMVMGGIVLFIADAYFGLGLVVAAALAFTSFLRPLGQQLGRLRDPFFRARHGRPLRRGVAAAVVLVLALLLVPLPDNRVLNGVAEAVAQAPLFTDVAGIIQQVHVRSGSWVEPGTALVTMANPELEAELAGVAAQVARAQLQASKALEGGAVDLAPLRERLRTLAVMQATLEGQLARLAVVAGQAGVWVAPDIATKRGSWVGRGVELGRLVDDRAHLFRGVIRQDAGAILSGAQRDRLEVRLEGERGHSLHVSRMSLVPYSSTQLPSAALSPAAGGEIAVEASDPSGRRSVEPYFLLEARIEDPDWQGGAPGGEQGVRTGRSGWIRIPLPWRPAAAQAWTGLRQFFQRRYRV